VSDEEPESCGSQAAGVTGVAGVDALVGRQRPPVGSRCWSPPCCWPEACVTLWRVAGISRQPGRWTGCVVAAREAAVAMLSYDTAPWTPVAKASDLVTGPFQVSSGRDQQLVPAAKQKRVSRTRRWWPRRWWPRPRPVTTLLFVNQTTQAPGCPRRSISGSRGG